LFYTTDFADRLENEIIPALRAGFVVLTDRYIYSLIARAMVRGLDPEWVRNIHRFALKPDAVFYLRIGVDELIPRAVFTRGFDYWESGMDFYSTEDMYDSFRRYQTALLERFDQLAEEFQFHVIDARPEPRVIFEQLREGISSVLTNRPAPEPVKPAALAATAPAAPTPAPASAPSASATSPATAEKAEGALVTVPDSTESADESRRTSR
jgi:dTMP kinase